MNLLGTNKRHEETNYCAFYDGKKFNYAKSGLSLPKFRVSQTFIHILFLFYFVNTPFAVHYEKIRIHLREKAKNFGNLHILAPKKRSFTRKLDSPCRALP